MFKGWVQGKGFGFIKGDKGLKDVFVLKKDAPDHERMTQGCTVEYNVEDSDRGLTAKNVVLIRVAAEREPHRDFPNLRMGLIKFWADKNGFGFIEPDDKGEDVFLNLNELKSSGLTTVQEGDIVEFATGKSDRGLVAFGLKVVGWKETGNEFLDTISIKNLHWKNSLAELSEKENWDYAEKQSNTYFPILENYIKYTFLRLQETDGLRFEDSGQSMSFNTGLVTENQESIFCICAKNGEENARPWRFDAFVKESQRGFVDRFGSNIPPLAEYFEDPSELLFDRRLNLFVNIDHILENISRFPQHLQENMYMARQLLTSAQVQTEKRVYRNYKTAIPQFFRDRGGKGAVQLLLPICLENPGVADLALTVAKNDDGTAYLSSTVLTLDMAYCNARLLARPDTEWLKP